MKNVQAALEDDIEAEIRLEPRHLPHKKQSMREESLTAALGNWDKLNILSFLWEIHTNY